MPTVSAPGECPLLLPNTWKSDHGSGFLVFLIAVPLGLLFDLEHEHHDHLSNHLFHVGPKFLIRLPGSLSSSIAFPDFSVIFGAISIKYIIMDSLVGSIESLLSVSAVDSRDPEKKSSDRNRDLLAIGIGNTIVSSLGGLPMISKIVRSRANIDNGAKSHLSTFFLGMFLLLSLALIPGLLMKIPLAALAGRLISTGFRLASPKEFLHVYKIGSEQLFLFVTTMIGVAVGLAMAVDASVETVTINFENAWVVDHTVLEKRHGIERSWTARRKARPAVAA